MLSVNEEEVALSEYIDYNCANRQIGQFLDAVYQHKVSSSRVGEGGETSSLASCNSHKVADLVFHSMGSAHY